MIETLQAYFQQEAIHYKIAAAFLYGSRAAGLSRHDSDVDLAVIFEDEGASEEELFERINGMAIRLTDILGCEVNLIPIYRDFRKPMLYYNAIVKGVPVYMADSQHYAHLVNEAIFQMEDFEIFGKGWQIALARQNLRELQNG